MKILITGSQGLVGSKITPRFEKAGDEVVRYDIALDARHDIFDIDRLSHAAQDCDAFVHLVAHPHRGSAPDWESFKTLNVEGAQIAWNACIKAKVPRFVYASTGNVYCFGDGIQDDLEPPIKLNDVPYPDDERVHWYPKTKLIMESWIKAQYHDGRNYIAPTAVILRPNWIDSGPQPDWFGACLSTEKMAEGFWRACHVSMPERYNVFDLIEPNSNFEGSTLAEQILFAPQV